VTHDPSKVINYFFKENKSADTFWQKSFEMSVFKFQLNFRIKSELRWVNFVKCVRNS
jgi:hypothetical protein